MKMKRRATEVCSKKIFLQKILQAKALLMIWMDMERMSLLSLNKRGL